MFSLEEESLHFSLATEFLQRDQSIIFPHKILIISDAWYPQVNGVVRTFTRVTEELKKMGHQVVVMSPNDYVNVPCPTYTEIRLAIGVSFRMPRMIEEIAPDAIHIATEGPLGITARRYCLRHNIPFTTSYHTKFPEYLESRIPTIHRDYSYPWFRRFHASSEAVLVPTPSIKNELQERGFRNLQQWSRGVDTDLFQPTNFKLDLPGPIYTYVGRIAIEKNVEAFLSCPLKGSKVIVGDGPIRESLQKKYPNAHFVGYKKGKELTDYFSASDVFVFPSKTDTFGLVMLEALACGTPVAAYPVTGPVDVLSPRVGVMKENLQEACEQALQLRPKDCIQHAQKYSWNRTARVFREHLRHL